VRGGATIVGRYLVKPDQKRRFGIADRWIRDHPRFAEVVPPPATVALEWPGRRVGRAVWKLAVAPTRERLIGGRVHDSLAGNDVAIGGLESKYIAFAAALGAPPSADTEVELVSGVTTANRRCWSTQCRLSKSPFRSGAACRSHRTYPGSVQGILVDLVAFNAWEVLYFPPFG
jgi:hypothetical protein